MKKTYEGCVAVPEEKIEKWRTQIWRSYQKNIAKWPDLYGGKTYTQKDIATHGGSGMYHFAKKEIREQLHIPRSQVFSYCVKQKRIVRKIGNVWYFEVVTRPRSR
jgi:hypothetical protein